MSRQTLMETLKGGILGLILLLLALLVAGGIMKWRMDKAPDGPQYKVQVNVPAQMDAAGTAGRTGPMGFEIPDGAVDVERPESRGDECPAAPMPCPAFLREHSGYTVTCRHFAWAASPGDVVEACGYLMNSPADAFSLYSRGRPHPDTMRTDVNSRGYLTDAGFVLVRGKGYFEVRRANNGDNARKLAIAFAAGLAGQDFGPTGFEFLAGLPAADMVAGSETLYMPSRFAPEFGSYVATAEYRVGEDSLMGGISRTESPDQAVAQVDAYAKRRTGEGAEKRRIPGAQGGAVVLIQRGRIEAVGSSGGLVVFAATEGGVSAAVTLIRTLMSDAGQLRGPAGNASEAPAATPESR